MISSISQKWLQDMPETIVAGDGCTATALASCLGASLLSIEDARGEPVSADESMPMVLDGLKRLLLVVRDGMAPADALHAHEALWLWTTRLTAAGDQHDLAFVFILPPAASSNYGDALSLGLSLASTDSASKGYGFWHPSGHLSQLVHLLGSIQPADLVAFRARMAADSQIRILKRLWHAASRENPDEVRAVVGEVMRAFMRMEYALDVFCRPPSHHNGNMLRNWLRAGVTGEVTPEWCREGKNRLPEWLIIAQGDCEA